MNFRKAGFDAALHQKFSVPETRAASPEALMWLEC